MRTVIVAADQIKKEREEKKTLAVKVEKKDMRGLWKE